MTLVRTQSLGTMPDASDSAALLATMDETINDILTGHNNEQLQAEKRLRALVDMYIAAGHDPQAVVAKATIALPSEVIDMLTLRTAQAA